MVIFSGIINYIVRGISMNKSKKILFIWFSTFLFTYISIFTLTSLVTKTYVSFLEYNLALNLISTSAIISTICSCTYILKQTNK